MISAAIDIEMINKKFFILLLRNLFMEVYVAKPELVTILKMEPCEFSHILDLWNGFRIAF